MTTSASRRRAPSCSGVTAGAFILFIAGALYVLAGGVLIGATLGFGNSHRLPMNVEVGNPAAIGVALAVTDAGLMLVAVSILAIATRDMARYTWLLP